MRACLRVGLLLALTLGSGGCRFISTSLERVVREPGRFHGQEITVSGRIEAIRWRPELGSIALRITDGHDSLLVLSADDPPDPQESVRLQGQLLRSFRVEGKDRPVLFLKSDAIPANGGGAR